jgi:hypothetical protein
MAADRVTADDNAKFDPTKSGTANLLLSQLIAAQLSRSVPTGRAQLEDEPKNEQNRKEMKYD